MAATLRQLAAGTWARARRAGPHGIATGVSYGVLALFVGSIWLANAQHRVPWAQPAWEVQAYLTRPDGRPVDVNDLVFIDRQHGWAVADFGHIFHTCLLYTSPSPRDS